MTFVRIKPQRQGGGRNRKPPTASLQYDGQLVINHAAAALIGSPSRVIMEVDFTSIAIRLRPTTPTDQGGFSLSGGGNAQYRISCKALIVKDDRFVGKYDARRIDGWIELRKMVAAKDA